jgi:hypothetical protein
VSWIFLSAVRVAHSRHSLIPAIFFLYIGDDGNGVLACSVVALVSLLSEYICTFARVHTPSCLFILSYSK